jgi:hypothetical protein
LAAGIKKALSKLSCGNFSTEAIIFYGFSIISKLVAKKPQKLSPESLAAVKLHDFSVEFQCHEMIVSFTGQFQLS